MSDDFQGARAKAGDTLLIYAPVPLHRAGGRPDGALTLEGQACNGLRLWAENFARVISMMPLAEGPPPPDWVPLTEVGPSLERIRIEPMPVAWRPDRFLRALPAARRRIRALIDEADYLSFSIGGLFGDWGSVACVEARRMGRPYAVWTDRVESEVVRRSAGAGPWRARLRARLTHRPMAALERALIRRADLGLFHGRETYATYAPFCRRPEVVHDIHIAAADHIAPEALAAKTAAAAEGPLRIVYVGRADPMKGPLDWVAALAGLAARGVDFRATWLGDGTERAAMRREIAAAGLDERVSTPGFAADRGAVLEALRAAHVFLFCHKTPESPRCLIEALISGTPIVGYDGAFARDLIADHGGGRLAPLNDAAALTEILAQLAADRPALAELFARAARDGAPFDDVSVFRHRSELIRAGLPPRRSAAQ
ncbi:glycosyltransferase [Oceanicella actignis]|uniref:Glycosyltransferase involved in cell wall bisynthesis n=1 Tax=Oceanicella actignis TaxID=1189325 RepID=A0A1M7T523_9RHOB|nr:glycosyltransferase [Oceanicella actignis]SET42392.1 Glycosyltransferase involved in cell wall bisynthesis [Oceanicella actignis]SHN65772.1 Glycosyltransferase involved in cell wall bisynthesis [Oceanicella actignis]